MQKKIAHITDTHLGDKTALDRGIDPGKNLEAVLDAIAENAIDEIVFTGDIGEINCYAWFFRKLEQYKPGFKIILGNHDNYSEAIKYFTNPQPRGENELYYSYEDEVYTYLFLDSSSSAISSAQLQWLSAEVSRARQIIVFIHHPILSIPTGMDITYPLFNRDEVAAILERSSQPVTVFCGHYHMPDKRTTGKITQYVTPATSFQVKKFSPKIAIDSGSYGFRIISLTERGVDSRLVISNYDSFIP